VRAWTKWKKKIFYPFDAHVKAWVEAA